MRRHQSAQDETRAELGRDVEWRSVRECSYDWSISARQAVALVADVPARYAEPLAGSNGSQRHPDLGWTAGAYVCHVTDKTCGSASGWPMLPAAATVESPGARAPSQR